MSRSKPTNNNPNPATRWFEWSGSKGNLHYYDRETKQQVEVALPFEFVLLDELATVKGWHDASQGNIYANEVRRTTKEPLTVRSYAMLEPLAKGLYSEIKDRVKAAGGRFVSNLYIGYTDGDEMKIGSLQFKGAALRAWSEFKNENNPYDGWIVIPQAIKGKKGSIEFFSPEFIAGPIEKASQDQALMLDEGLQTYLDTYFAKGVEATVNESQEYQEEPLAPTNSDGTQDW